MEISKSNKTISAEVMQQLQNLDSQTSSETEAKPVGLVKDDSLERMQAVDPFAASFQAEYGSAEPELNAVSGSGGQTQLGQGAAGNNSAPASDAAVSESYAAKAEENKQTVDNENSYSAIRKEIAGALEVDESDPVVDQTYQDLASGRRVAQIEANAKAEAARIEADKKAEAARVEANNQIINDALTYGRRVQQPTLPDEVLITEYVPGERTENPGDMKVYIRTGNEITDGDRIIRTIRYYEQGNFSSLGQVKSVIEDGIETILEVRPNPNFPDAIALKPGDTRTVPGSKNTAAGAAPSTWDPQPDGRYGNTSGSSSSGTNTGQTSNNDSIDSSGRFGGPQSGNEGTGRSGAASDPSAVSTSLYIRGTDVREDGSVLIVLSDGTSQEFSSVAEAMEWTKAQNLSAPPSQSKSQPATNDEETHTSVEGNTTVEVEEPDAQEPTDEEVEETETNENEQAAAEAEQEEEEGSQAGWGDYADTGPEPPAEQGRRGYMTTTGDGSNTAKTFSNQYVPDTTYADKPGGPIDYGDPNDPNASEQMNLANFHYHMGKNPSVTDPANPEGGEESATIESIRLDMAGTLRDGADAMDHQDALGWGDRRPNPNEDVHTTGESDDGSMP